MSSEIAGHSEYFAALLGVALFVGMLVMQDLGRRLSARHDAHAAGTSSGIGAVEGAAFGLMGLMIAFTFSGASDRFESRRELIGREANAVETAWMRIDLVPAAFQPSLRDGFRQYLDARLSAYGKLRPDPEAARAEFARARGLEREVWSRAVAACPPDADNNLCEPVVESLSDMIEIANSRTMAMEDHPPTIIFVLLFGLALGCALLAGYGMGDHPRKLHMMGFAAVTAVSVYVILDLEYPRIGFIRIDSTDHVLYELRQSMD